MPFIATSPFLLQYAIIILQIAIVVKKKRAKKLPGETLRHPAVAGLAHRRSSSAFTLLRGVGCVIYVFKSEIRSNLSRPPRAGDGQS
jgi:hypothetical protein